MEMTVPGLGTQLRLLTTRLDGDVQVLYDELGVAFRPRFFPLLQHLLEFGPKSVSALARAAGVSQPAATQTLGEMAKLGLVELAAGADARERLAAPTRKAVQLADQLRPVWESIAAAARELDQELPHGLGETLGSALDALNREPFLERIRRKIKA